MTGWWATPTAWSSYRPHAVEDVLLAGRARAEKEEGLFEALTDGATTVELLGLDPSPVDVA